MVEGAETCSAARKLQASGQGLERAAATAAAVLPPLLARSTRSGIFDTKKGERLQ